MADIDDHDIVERDETVKLHMEGEWLTYNAASTRMTTACFDTDLNGKQRWSGDGRSQVWALQTNLNMNNFIFLLWIEK
uniref:Uncharacterized protein n=1 Tax=Cannabis sativa TaxID=3483 RepID=A0A803Q2T7_CANSA